MASTVCTKLDVHSNSMQLIWKISNFSFFPKGTEEFYRSPYFKFALDENVKWFLALYPNGYSNINSGFVSLYFFRDKNSPKIDAIFSFSILSPEGNEENKYEDEKTISEDTGCGTGKFISISNIKKYIRNDNLSIVCNITVGFNLLSQFVHDPMAIVTTGELSQDFEILFENKKFTDVIIAVKGKTFNAHKIILSARSWVFSALFEHEMQENINNIVNIEDAEPNVVEEMLRFIYTGKVKDINLIACEVLRIADKYFLEGLKSICEDTLWESLSVENVLKILSLADLHNAKTLKKKALEFSVANAKEIIQTAEFKSLEHLNLQILSELFQELAKART